jgi:hypothetical protein
VDEMFEGHDLGVEGLDGRLGGALEQISGCGDAGCELASVLLM